MDLITEIKHRLLLVGLYSVGPIVLFMALNWFWETRTFLADAERAEAVTFVSARASSEGFGKGSFKFKTPDGTEQLVTLNTSHSYVRGEKVPMVYPKGKPEEARINNFTELYLENIYFGLFALLLCLPYYFKFLVPFVRLIPGFVDESERDGTTIYISEENFNEPTGLDLQANTSGISSIHVFETYEFEDPETGEIIKFDKKEDIPQEYRRQLKEMSDQIKASLKDPGDRTNYTFTTKSGEEKTVSDWDELPDDVQEEFQSIILDFE